MARLSTAQPRCLVVEDEALIGVDLEHSLCEAGLDARWVASTQGALDALASVAFDVAVLDFVLRSQPCTAIARALQRRNIPFLVYSGYPRDRDPAGFPGVPWLEKPADPAALVAALTEILDATGARRRARPDVVARAPQAIAR